MRILVAGGPRTGKTTLADAVGADRGIRVRHTDDLAHRLEWREASAEVARWLTEPGPWIIEGVAASRALRKLEPSAPLPDIIAHLTIPHVMRTSRQESMAKGEASVWWEILPELQRRGARILTDTEGEALVQAMRAAFAGWA